MMIMIALLIWLMIVILVSTADIKEKTLMLTSIVLLVGLIVIALYVETHIYKAEIASFMAQKQTIEQAIQSENMSDIEKKDLVKLASELNSELANNKIIYNQIFFFYLDRSEINEVEPINLDS